MPKQTKPGARNQLVNERIDRGGYVIGHRAADAPVNNYEQRRVPLDEQVRF